MSYFLFKQKTAYEMRISDWSSDVCSSDLIVAHNFGLGEEEAELKFFVNVDFQASSSFLAQTDVNLEAFPQLERTEERVAKVRRLDEVAPELGIEPELVVKIDTQGYEAHVIRGGRETLRGAEIGRAHV